MRGMDKLQRLCGLLRVCLCCVLTGLIWRIEWKQQQGCSGYATIVLVITEAFSARATIGLLSAVEKEG